MDDCWSAHRARLHAVQSEFQDLNLAAVRAVSGIVVDRFVVYGFKTDPRFTRTNTTRSSPHRVCAQKGFFLPSPWEGTEGRAWTTATRTFVGGVKKQINSHNNVDATYKIKSSSRLQALSQPSPRGGNCRIGLFVQRSTAFCLLPCLLPHNVWS